MVESVTPEGPFFFVGQIPLGQEGAAAEMNPTGKTKRGQALVEFALLVPIMLLLVIGIAEFGRAWMTENILTGAAREGARVAAVAQNTIPVADPGTARVNSVLSSALITADSVNVFDPGLPVNSIQVDVTYTRILLPSQGSSPDCLPSFPLTGTATMRRERY